MDETTPKARRFMVMLDLRDVIGVAGALAVLIGAAAFHWAAALIVLGLAACALAARLQRDADGSP